MKEGFTETQRNVFGSLSDLIYSGTEIKQKRPNGGPLTVLFYSLRVKWAVGKENRAMSPEGKEGRLRFHFKLRFRYLKWKVLFFQH